MKMQPEPLYEVHEHGRFRLTPRAMQRPQITAEQNQAAQRIALSIFTDMSNASFSLRESLAAIYLSGLQHGCAVLGRQPQPLENRS